jgi:hypothetical protein
MAGISDNFETESPKNHHCYAWFKLVSVQIIFISSSNKTDHHDITEILLKVALNTINPYPF